MNEGEKVLYYVLFPLVCLGLKDNIPRKELILVEKERLKLSKKEQWVIEVIEELKTI